MPEMPATPTTDKKPPRPKPNARFDELTSLPKLAVGEQVMVHVSGKVMELGQQSYGDDPKPYFLRLDHVTIKVMGDLSDDEIAAMTDMDLDQEMKNRHGMRP